jgi:hypothetical protein
VVEKHEPNNMTELQSRTLYKNRYGKAVLVRSASKNKDDSIPKSTQKESNTINLKKKYESIIGKGR